MRGVRQAARDTDAEYQALVARRREWIQRDTQAHRERQPDPAMQARLAGDQARIDEVLAQTEQSGLAVPPAGPCPLRARARCVPDGKVGSSP